MSQVLSIAVGKSVNEEGDWVQFDHLASKLSAKLGIQPLRLTIDPLSVDWYSALEAGHFRSGCAPIEALAEACRLIRSGEECAVVIHGRDFLKSEYTSTERRQAMAVYGDNMPLTEAYNLLAHEFMALNGISQEFFCELRDALFDNYCRTYTRNVASASLPGDRWLQPVTELFRGVDCANPVVDFEGAMLLTSASVARDLGLEAGACLEISGVGLGMLPEDGPQVAHTIASYDHLRNAFRTLDQQLDESLNSRFLRDDLLLDLYTCYPVVPLAALLTGGFVTSPDQLLSFIQRNPLTQTGGMNLARGAWNNPALNGLITMQNRLLKQNIASSGLVHGNGGLGYRQGVVLLTRYTPV
ncbi:hypothetical protein KOI40_08925 [Aestuariicella sp. G3-2]|uniref:hypothetical protein n=1 Tax=Pseudomaricurvus albidus TaxID=2842452 RepID=UPI001C0E5084|nr:hypothetical protein [Aestuariicella albida]MBU3069944.1 hypothetical protein [Aestuariicella albida]